LEYANKKGIPFVIVIGSEEVGSGLLTFKNMDTGEQENVVWSKSSNMILIKIVLCHEGTKTQSL